MFTDPMSGRIGSLASVMLPSSMKLCPAVTFAGIDMMLAEVGTCTVTFTNVWFPVQR